MDSAERVFTSGGSLATACKDCSKSFKFSNLRAKERAITASLQAVGTYQQLVKMVFHDFMHRIVPYH